METPGQFSVAINTDRFVLVHRSVLDRIEARIERGATTREAGGILLGSYRGEHIEIFDCTEPMKQDLRTRVLFDRKDPGHQLAASSAWKTSKGTDTYVGEWHTHPENHPNPSWLDQAMWRSLMRRSTAPLIFAIGGWSETWWGIGELGNVVRLRTAIVD